MRSKRAPRTPRRYDGTDLTAHLLSDLLPEVLGEIGSRYSVQPNAVLAAWPEVIGARFAPMAQAVSFVDGVLTVKVSNSTLYSLLIQHEKPRLLKQICAVMPKTTIRNIIFRMG